MSCGDSRTASGAGRSLEGSSRTTRNTISASSSTQNAPMPSQAPQPMPLYHPIIVATCLGPDLLLPFSVATPFEDAGYERRRFDEEPDRRSAPQAGSRAQPRGNLVKGRPDAPGVGAGSIQQAVPRVASQQTQGDLVQDTRRDADLGEHVDAVAVLLDHPGDAGDLALHHMRPGQVIGLAVVEPGAGGGRTVGCVVRDLRHVPRGGMWGEAGVETRKEAAMSSTATIVPAASGMHAVVAESPVLIARGLVKGYRRGVWPLRRTR